MSAITFDTYKFITELESSGVPHAQAEAMLKVQQQIIEHSIGNTLATKADLDKLERATKTDLDKVERKLSDEIKDVKSDIHLMKWMLSLIIGGILMLVLKAFSPA